MQKGSGALRVSVYVAGLIMVMVMAKGVKGREYVVGKGEGGWGFDFERLGWTIGKEFKEGDVLIFNYMEGTHNVVVMDEEGYMSCGSAGTRLSRVMESGNDRITLKKGTNLFICSVPGHCQGGMRLALDAA